MYHRCAVPGGTVPVFFLFSFVASELVPLYSKDESARILVVELDVGG